MRLRQSVFAFGKGGLSLLIFWMAVSGPALPLFAEETATLGPAPQVPQPVQRNQPDRVVVRVEAQEFVAELADGFKYQFWSFNGTVPGPLVRVRVGDTVEFHLKNAPGNLQPHNIDIHAVNGAKGGAELSTVSPGEEKVFTFKALAPGLYIYHCAAGSIVDHIANGMYGLILVEPEEGLPPVDREYYVMQSEFFTGEATDGVHAFDLMKGLQEHPTHVVFNGRDGALLGTQALKARVGETVRIYFGNIG
ncbi:MAG: multicopper oxidase domain-containing protein, partial [Nitrospinaceae bacterium]|nr:multicopper oxidase domain-containing protein [Nitrospinaceae bacterium]NIU44958.1 multicopper oxidase domain-containing protein [Nitrospinaceae bacterium]NIW06541.1 multicopper oxidase domain-containing protein [Nitrospinaceae bacterium]NIW59705.1 multicopper oxidase domain-containing protein [Nitrospinaceae bacterium]NIX35109.1 multicopper oxidase domain-containing protein [Nitrospinaceae bacterium]